MGINVYIPSEKELNMKELIRRVVKDIGQDAAVDYVVFESLKRVLSEKKTKELSKYTARCYVLVDTTNSDMTLTDTVIFKVYGIMEIKYDPARDNYIDIPFYLNCDTSLVVQSPEHNEGEGFHYFIIVDIYKEEGELEPSIS